MSCNKKGKWHYINKAKKKKNINQFNKWFNRKRKNVFNTKRGKFYRINIKNKSGNINVNADKKTIKMFYLRGMR